jgi:hypothetical protein
MLVQTEILSICNTSLKMIVESFRAHLASKLRKRAKRTSKNVFRQIYWGLKNEKVLCTLQKVAQIFTQKGKKPKPLVNSNKRRNLRLFTFRIKFAI